MLRLILNILTFGLVFVLVCASIIFVFWVVNKGVQLVANQLGYEVGDFWQWIKSKLPEIKWKKK